MAKGFKIICKTDKARQVLKEQDINDKNADVHIEGDIITFLFKPRMFKGLKGRMFQSMLSEGAVKLQMINSYPTLDIGKDFTVEMVQDE